MVCTNLLINKNDRAVRDVLTQQLCYKILLNHIHCFFKLHALNPIFIIEDANYTEEI